VHEAAICAEQHDNTQGRHNYPREEEPCSSPFHNELPEDAKDGKHHQPEAEKTQHANSVINTHFLVKIENLSHNQICFKGFNNIIILDFPKSLCLF